jgi:hypothetical protein
MQRAWGVPCEELDHIVITRLCELAQYEGRDMSDRIAAFWEHRKSEELDEARLLDTQLKNAEAQIRRLDKLLTDPATPLSADAERRYIEMRCDAEADRDRLLKKQATLDQHRDPAEVVPNFYYVLAHLPTEYKRLTPEEQKRMARQVTQDIRLNMISPHLFLLHIKWQTGIALRPDVALVWRGKGARIGYDWAPDEEAIIKSLYPDKPQADIMKALPQRAWQSIREHAGRLGLRRIAPGAGAVNTYYVTMSYADLEAVERLTDDPQQQDRLRRLADDLARRTVRGGLSAHWWFPLKDVSYAGNDGAGGSMVPALFNVSLLYEARH